MTDVISDLCFAPTEGARDNLLRAGIELSRIIVTGQTGIDAVLYAAAIGACPEDLPTGPYVVITLHRRENWAALESVARVLGQVARAYPDRTFVFPMHLNPVVREAVRPSLAGISNVRLIEPLSHGAMAALLSRSELIITDSGGLQEEGLTLGVPVVVLREVTERPEAVIAGNSILCGTDPEMVRHAVADLLERRPAAPANCENPFGDGRASLRVAEGVAWRLGSGTRPADWVVRPTIRVVVDR
jgi:UDP-N-acetylglucosamine 2-epimerase (non-hydrolysing)